MYAPQLDFKESHVSFSTRTQSMCLFVISKKQKMDDNTDKVSFVRKRMQIVFCKETNLDEIVCVGPRLFISSIPSQENTKLLQRLFQANFFLTDNFVMLPIFLFDDALLLLTTEYSLREYSLQPIFLSNVEK